MKNAPGPEDQGLSKNDREMMDIKPESPAGAFGELVRLAESIGDVPRPPEKPVVHTEAGVQEVRAEEAKEENPNTAETVEAEKTRTARRLVEEVMTKRDNVALRSGRESYDILAYRMDPRKAHEASSVEFGSINFGSSGHPHPSGGRMGSPEDYLVTYDDMVRYQRDWITKQNPTDMTPEEFVARYGDAAVDSFRPENFGQVWLVYPGGAWNDVVKYKDLNDPQLAFDVFSSSTSGPNNERRFSDLYLQRAKMALGTFTEAAMEADDVPIALEGLKRLGRVDDQEAVAKIKSSMEKLRDSTDSRDREKLRMGLLKIREMQSDQTA